MMIERVPNHENWFIASMFINIFYMVIECVNMTFNTEEEKNELIWLSEPGNTNYNLHRTSFILQKK